MIQLANRTVADVVTENIKTANVFKKHGIDFCCGGRISLEQACERNNVDYELLSQELLESSKDRNYNEDYSWWDAEVLIDHIVEHHHEYIKETLPILLSYSDKVAKVHGEHAPEVIQINALFQSVAVELMEHLRHEEDDLFPKIAQLNQSKKGMNGQKKSGISLTELVVQMEDEHNNAGDAFKQIRLLSNDFTPPEWACNTYRALYHGLEEFETDLHVHIHLENNVLHGAALKLAE